MGLGAFVLDAWAGLSFKRGAGGRLPTSERTLASPSWIPPEDRSRIEAYRVLASYFANVARVFTPADTTNEDRRAHREYGDAALLVKTVRAAVLGEDQDIVVEGAGDDPGPEPEQPDGADAQALAAWRADHAEWTRRRDETDRANERQEWLRTWASPEVERLASKMMEVELDAEKLGDGVMVVAWSSSKRRPRLRLFDADSYFPVLDDGTAEDEFTRRLHIAWGFEEGTGTERRPKIRRLTWWLGPIRTAVDEQGFPTDELLPGTSRDARGVITRQLPYASEPTAETCYYSDGVWDLPESGDVADLSPAAARWTVAADGTVLRDVDLGIDFIPVVHLPNTVAVKGHYGEALLTSLAQILDDLANADTDTAKAADLVGVPMIGVSGVGVGEDVAVRPGALLRLGTDGKLSTVDLSAGLVALEGHVERLLHRLTTNARVPDAVLGSVDPAKLASGLHMLLTFGPLRSLVAEQRLVRDEKYPLLLKMVQRWAMVAGAAVIRNGGTLAPGELDPAVGVLPARIAFGSFLPNDRASAIDEVIKLYDAHLISRRRALEMLRAIGVEMGDDLETELLAAEREDFEAALQLLEATGDEQAVADFLGRQVAAAPPPAPAPAPTNVPPISLPGAPPA